MGAFKLTKGFRAANVPLLAEESLDLQNASVPFFWKFATREWLIDPDERK
jgi:hypothetical protein